MPVLPKRGAHGRPPLRSRRVSEIGRRNRHDRHPKRLTRPPSGDTGHHFVGLEGERRAGSFLGLARAKGAGSAPRRGRAGGPVPPRIPKGPTQKLPALRGRRTSSYPAPGLGTRIATTPTPRAEAGVDVIPAPSASTRKIRRWYVLARRAVPSFMRRRDRRWWEIPRALWLLDGRRGHPALIHKLSLSRFQLVDDARLVVMLGLVELDFHCEIDREAQLSTQRAVERDLLWTGDGAIDGLSFRYWRSCFVLLLGKGRKESQIARFALVLFPLLAVI